MMSFHIGFQLFDDIDDFKRDIVSGQRTYCGFLVDYFIAKNSLKIGGEDILLKYKLLFLSGITDQQLQRAILYFEKSRAVIHHLPLAEYKNVIQQNIERAERLRWEIQHSIKKTQNRMQLSSVKVNSIAKSPVAESINSSIISAVGFPARSEDSCTG